MNEKENIAKFGWLWTKKSENYWTYRYNFKNVETNIKGVGEGRVANPCQISNRTSLSRTEWKQIKQKATKTFGTGCREKDDHRGQKSFPKLGLEKQK